MNDKMAERNGGSADRHSVPASIKTTLAFLIFIEVTSGFVQGYYTPLLPQLSHYLGVSGEAMNWFQTAQAMAAAVSVPLLSRLGDVHGHRKVLRWAITSVLVGTVVIALVPSYPVVLAARTLIGPLGVWLPLAIAIIYAKLSGGGARRAISILSASLMLGIVLGTVTAGFAIQVTQTVPLLLLVPSLMVAVSLYAVLFKIPESTDLAQAKIDWTGFGGLAVVMVGIILALAFMGPTHAGTAWVLFGGTVAVFVAWIWWERRAASPAVDLQLVTSPKMGPLYLTGALLGAIIIDAPANLSDFLSRDPDVYGFGFNANTATVAGMIALMLLFATAGGFASSFVAARVGMRRTLVVSALVSAFGQALLIGFSGVMVIFWVSGVLTGLGLGVLVGSLPALVAEAAPADKTGIATGLYNALVAMGGAVGGALFKQIVVAFRDADKQATLAGYLTIWAVSIAIFLIAALLMSRVKLGGAAAESV